MVVLCLRASIGMILAALIPGTKTEINIVSAEKIIIAAITGAWTTIGIVPRMPSAPKMISASRILLPSIASVIFVPIYPKRSPRGMPIRPSTKPS